MRKIPLLFEICFIKLFKNSCAHEINDTLNKIFGDIPVATLKINYNKIKPGLPHLLEKQILHLNPDYEEEYYISDDGEEDQEEYYYDTSYGHDEEYYESDNTIEYNDDGEEEFSTEEIDFTSDAE
jgi:hypothetical protein